MRSEYSANKALYETFQIAKKVAQTFNKNVSSIRPEAKLSDMDSMKAFQAKSGVVGKAIYLID